MGFGHCKLRFGGCKIGFGQCKQRFGGCKMCFGHCKQRFGGCKMCFGQCKHPFVMHKLSLGYYKLTWRRQCKSFQVDFVEGVVFLKIGLLFFIDYILKTGIVLLKIFFHPFKTCLAIAFLLGEEVDGNEDG